MAFQALPIAFRANTGSPLAKLVWIWIINECEIDEGAPNGSGSVEIDIYRLARFAQATVEEVKAAIDLLVRMNFLGAVWPGSADDYQSFDVNLPMTELRKDERKRIKCSPDQIERLVSLGGHRCATCGRSDDGSFTWHVDHIIPRSKGGADVEENCQTICGSCNSKKGARMDWVDFLR